MATKENSSGQVIALPKAEERYKVSAKSSLLTFIRVRAISPFRSPCHPAGMGSSRTQPGL